MDYQAGGGGGFNASSPPSSAGGNRGTRKSYDEQTIQPVSIGMCLSARGDDSGLELTDGRSLHHIKIVAAVRGVSDFSTNHVFDVEDGTGRIDVKQWTDTNDNTVQVQIRASASREHRYIVVIGQLKDFDGKKTILADSIRSVATGNELTHHLLEVVYVAESYKRRNSFINAGPPTGFGQPIAGTPLVSSAADGDMKDVVLNSIQTLGDTEQGIHIDELVQRLGAKFPEQQVRAVVNDLSGEGMIYSTIDENYYKYAG